MKNMGSLTSVQKNTKGLITPFSLLAIICGILIFVYPLQFLQEYERYLTIFFGFCIGFVLLGVYVSSSLKSVTRFSSVSTTSNSIKSSTTTVMNNQNSMDNPAAKSEVLSPSSSHTQVKKQIETHKSTDSSPKKQEPVTSTVSQKSDVKLSANLEKSSTPEIHMDSSDFLAKIIKLGDIAKECEEMVETEDELSQKEKAKLYLKRDEFKKLLLTIKGTSRTVF